MNWTRMAAVKRDGSVKRLALLFLAPAAIALAACSTQAATEGTGSAAAQPSVHPVSGLQVVDLTVTSRGSAHRFRVEVAASAQEQQRGLMFRTQMGADEGMIFPFPQARMASFWMRNTVIPLDIIFIGPDNRVLNIAAMTTPYSEESVRSIAPASAVLELNGGRAEQLGIAPGDMVDW